MLARLIIGIGTIFSLGFSSLAFADCTTPTSRYVIKFYEYAGTQTPSGAQNFSVFRQVIDEEVNRLGSAVGAGQYARRLKTEPPNSTGSNSPGYSTGHLNPTLSVNAMEADPRLLVLLDGRVQAARAANTYVVHSDIYLFPEQGTTAPGPISEDFLLVPDDHDSARSVHLAATYYALAIEARGNACRATQVAFLARAYESLRDIKTNDHFGVKILADLVHAAQRDLGLMP